MPSDLDTHGLAIEPATQRIDPALLDELYAVRDTLPPPPPSALKPFLVQWLGRYPPYEPDSVWGRIGEVLRPTVEAYCRQPVRLYFYNLWQTTVCTDPPIASQVWHQDQEDIAIVKAFLYLSDVTADAGPLQYVPGTHWRGALRLTPAIHKERFGQAMVSRVRDEDMDAVAPRATWRTAIAPAGSLVWADTAGWHKGGYATGRERWLAMWHFVTAQCPHGVRFGS